MKIKYTLLFPIVILLTFCRNKGPEQVIERDTTITSENAFSALSLDSARLENFIIAQKVEDSTAHRLRNFYNSRNYHFAWFTQDGLAEQTLAFWNLHNSYIQLSNDSSVIDKRLHQQMEVLINEDTAINEGSEQIIETELQLTEHFFEYAQYAYAGKIDPKELQWHIPRKKVNAAALLDSLISNKNQNLEQWEPVHLQYKWMNKELKRYYDINKAGGWKEISLSKKRSYKPGDSALAIKQVKLRLMAVGDYKAEDSSQLFTNELLPAVKRVQKRFGFNANGHINAALVSELNVPVQKRIEQMLVNMERMRWMPKEPEGNRIVANIPEFKLHVFESSKKVFDMDIVVGTSANKTVVFNDMLKYVVFSPYWNIPRSIVKNEILPAMQRSSGYLSNKNMEQTGFSNGLPVIRQRPGGSNALGKVKFIFPNSFNIYFHDTPSKSLFGREKRAFSHGCIRLAEPKKMATYLLRNQPKWTNSTIVTAMNASKEKWVTLQAPVPVIITYFTAWVDNEGLLNFREDIYGRDKKLAERLLEN